ncbi:MAG: sulfotransferase domain-containing protein [Anaerolineales bacterium]|nr:sulfotransferase domain-containing protein [Anaerolineales bacterium]
MDILYTTKNRLKIARWQARRLAAALRWGPQVLNSAPAVLGNAMPKSGSHLISQVIQGLPRIGPFVDPGFMPVTRSEDNSKLSEQETLENLQRMQPGDIAYGYVKASEPFISALTQPGRATIFVYRDPRDMVVSHVFYATQMHKGHGMHRYYTETLQTMEERIEAAIRGVEEPGSELSSVRDKYLGYLGWLEQPAVLCLRFEDLILERQAALGRILNYLEGRGGRLRLERQQAIAILEQAIVPKKSGTFRKGKPGNWQEHFTAANKALFKELASDILIQLGYEQNNDW